MTVLGSFLVQVRYASNTTFLPETQSSRLQLSSGLAAWLPSGVGLPKPKIAQKVAAMNRGKAIAIVGQRRVNDRQLVSAGGEIFDGGKGPPQWTRQALPEGRFEGSQAHVRLARQTDRTIENVMFRY